MSVTTYEGVVESGQIRLPDDVRLPERARVFVVVPSAPARSQARLMSPRLADPAQIADFAMEVTEEPADDALR